MLAASTWACEKAAARGRAGCPAQYLGDLGCEYVVFKNDEKTVEEIRAMNPRGILVSPGPGADAGRNQWGRALTGATGGQWQQCHSWF